MRRPRQITEYRINKKSCESFRSRSPEDVRSWWTEHGCEGNPKYTVQYRYIRLDKYGMMEGSWSIWYDCKVP